MKYIPLIDHFPGCSPLHPCGSCQLRDFLKKKLSEKEFSQMIIRLRLRARRQGSKPKRISLKNVDLLQELQGIVKSVSGMYIEDNRVREAFKLPPLKGQKTKPSE